MNKIAEIRKLYQKQKRQTVKTISKVDMENEWTTLIIGWQLVGYVWTEMVFAVAKYIAYY